MCIYSSRYANKQFRNMYLYIPFYHFSYTSKPRSSDKSARSTQHRLSPIFEVVVLGQNGARWSLTQYDPKALTEMNKII